MESMVVPRTGVSLFAKGDWMNRTQCVVVDDDNLDIVRNAEKGAEREHNDDKRGDRSCNVVAKSD